MASGDDLTAGRTREGESTTGVLGGRPDELDVPFNGTVVFSAGPRTDDQRPDTPVCGLRGVGWNGGDGFIPTAGGCGVLGFGAAQMGTGIIGLGGGARHAGPFITWTMADGPEGAGGVGVFGRGGDGLPLGHQSPPDPLLFNPSPPGAGVVGRGGTSRFPAPGPAHGAGVIGVAGGVDEAAFPTLAEAGNVGVFGQGGTAGEQLAGVTVGAPEPGPGSR